MVRIDMSEYQEKHTVSRLIGAPPGYVGYEEAGQLTEAVRRRPYAVVLFDEIEKAHPEVLNVLLQLLDDGRLTDGKGRTVDFKNTVVIMTSNLGSQFIADAAARGDALDEGVRRQVIEALRTHFRPEFLNRIDDIIFFHARRSRAHQGQIDRHPAGRSCMKRLEERKIALDAHRRGPRRTDSSTEGYDPIYGARPLKRDDSAPAARSAGAQGARGRVQRRRPRAGGRGDRGPVVLATGGGQRLRRRGDRRPLEPRRRRPAAPSRRGALIWLSSVNGQSSPASSSVSSVLSPLVPGSGFVRSIWSAAPRSSDG